MADKSTGTGDKHSHTSIPRDQSTSRDESRYERRLSRPTTGMQSWSTSPFQGLQRFVDEMDRMIGDFGGSRRWFNAPSWRETLSQMWAPNVDVFQKDDQLTIRVDLPGLKKDEVSVDITDEALVIEGERRRESEDEREGYYRSERSYGSFNRVIPLPQGAITEEAKATFRDGVLEITMPAPPEQARRGRRLEISEGTSTSGNR